MASWWAHRNFIRSDLSYISGFLSHFLTSIDCTEGIIGRPAAHHCRKDVASGWQIGGGPPILLGTLQLTFLGFRPISGLVLDVQMEILGENHTLGRFREECLRDQLTMRWGPVLLLGDAGNTDMEPSYQTVPITGGMSGLVSRPVGVR